MSIPDFCLACGRRYAPIPPTVADRNRARHADPERPRLRLPVVLGAAWWLAVAVVVASTVCLAVGVTR